LLVVYRLRKHDTQRAPTTPLHAITSTTAGVRRAGNAARTRMWSGRDTDQPPAPPRGGSHYRAAAIRPRAGRWRARRGQVHQSRTRAPRRTAPRGGLHPPNTTGPAAWRERHDGLLRSHRQICCESTPSEFSDTRGWGSRLSAPIGFPRSLFRTFRHTLCASSLRSPLRRPNLGEPPSGRYSWPGRPGSG
jgi:hypothetical protein